MLAIIAGVLFFGPAASWLGESYYFTEAHYVRQFNLDQFAGPNLRIEVRFTVHGQRKTAYIHPRYRRVSLRNKPVPIVYKTSDPAKAYYYGPGGDYYYVPEPFYMIAAIVLIAAGLYLIVSTVCWRRGISGIIKSHSSSRPVNVRWQQHTRRPLCVVATDLETDSEYAWEVISAETPVDGLFRAMKFLGRTGRWAPAESSEIPKAGQAKLFGEPGPHKWLILNTTAGISLPTSRAEPVIATDPPPTLPILNRTVLSAHRRLISAYAEAMVRAQALPVFVRPPVPYGVIPTWHSLRTLLCWRWLIRMHVESHIRRQLRHLSIAYVRCQFLSPTLTDAADQQRSRLAALREECELLNGSLTDVRRLASSSLLALAAIIPAVAVVIHIRQVQTNLLFQDLLHWLFFVLLIMPGLFALVAYTDSFRCKRRLFISSPAFDEKSHSRRESIYTLEDDLFATIKQQKRVERASDYWAYALILVTWTAFWVLAFSAQPYYTDRAVWVVFILITFVLVAVFIRTLLRRRSENR